MQLSKRLKQKPWSVLQCPLGPWSQSLRVQRHRSWNSPTAPTRSTPCSCRSAGRTQLQNIIQSLERSALISHRRLSVEEELHSNFNEKRFTLILSRAEMRALGKSPHCFGISPPSASKCFTSPSCEPNIVWVFPVPVCPYAMNVTL